jgi:hypothetical protein
MGCVIRTAHGAKQVNYQDIWFKGKAIQRGGRECEFRYHAIKKFLNKFKRPISVLDIGANMGYFSWRLMENFAGSFVMIEGEEYVAKILLRLCKLNNNPQAILLKGRLCLADLISLSEVEHFDVVMALSIIHHFDEPYQEVLQVLTRLGSYLIFEPPSLDEQTCYQERINQEPLDLSQFQKKLLVRTLTKSVVSKDVYRDTYAIFCDEKKTIKKPYFQALEELSTPCMIEANFKQRKATISGIEKDWRHGININTFLGLNGVYPTKKRLLSLLHDLNFKNEENGLCSLQELKSSINNYLFDGVHDEI